MTWITKVAPIRKWAARRAASRNAAPLLNEAVNFDLEVIFIAVPKTGSTSIRTQLAMPGPQMIPHPHLTILQVRDSLYPYFLTRNLGRNRSFPTDPIKVASDEETRALAAETFQRFFKFATVRNPWARVASLYHRREGVQTAATLDFETFCGQIHYASDTCKHPLRLQNQLDWIVDETGQVAVDYVLRLEEMHSGIDEINRLTGGRLTLVEQRRNQNAASPGNYRSLYSDRTREVIANTFKRDIEFFNYQF